MLKYNLKSRYGEVLETGSPEQVRASPAVQAAYLGGEELLHE